MDMGYKPVSANPEELVQIYEQNVAKYVMANKIKQDMLARGFWKTVRPGELAPQGFARIDDAIARIYLNPNITIREAYDEILNDKLESVIQDLGIRSERKASLGRGRGHFLGTANEKEGTITTRFASPLSVKAHELGHFLDYKYGLQAKFTSDPKLRSELTALADERFQGKDVTDNYKEYVRSNSEKMAVMLEAYIHAPELFKEVAPKTFGKFTSFVDAHEELKPILDIKPSLVYGMHETTINAGGPIVGGEHYAATDVARLLNNYLSKDRILDTALGKGVMNVKNTMNAFELGFSAFHLTMETFDTIITKFAIGLSKVSQFDLTGFKDMLVSPTAPVTYFRAGQQFYNGDPELLKIEDDLFHGGASLREKQYYKNTAFDEFLRNSREMGGMIKRGEVGTAAQKLPAQALRLPMAAIEATMRPLFTYYIPRLKVGAFRDLFAAELERNSAKIEAGEMTQEEVARNVWNNIENRMGELNYDNLFWNRTMKSGLILTTRAVGWNLGTAREIGGALFQDIPTEAKKAFTGKGFEFTPKMAYTLSLFFLVGAAGAIYQYLHTGEAPQSLKDLYYPRNGATDKNGEPYRIEFPTYLKDIYQSGVPLLFTGHPFEAGDQLVSMLKNKSSPELSTIYDIMNNQDFYGDMIRNPHDNTPTQAKQLTLYLLTQLVPFTLQQQQNLASGRSNLEQQTEAFFGLVKAPSAVIQSAYDAAVSQIYQDQAGGFAPRTPEQKAADNEKSQVVDQIKKGDYSGIGDLIQKGIIKPSGVEKFIQNAILTTPQKEFKYLSKQNKVKLGQQMAQ